MEDITIVCVDCSKSFIFSASEQKYFQDRQLTQPKRCPPCRKARRSRLQNPSMHSEPSVDSLVSQQRDPYPPEPYHHKKEDWRHNSEKKDF